ncbi:hypothetical protein QC763_311193 [Podospora pseudopauciseta]|uniref:Uncharacterized protein n=2 Tax=Podospora TaxID=5144 RepID=A0ABR0HHQ9_9PEZI|nr:hypothetical protein QC763_311193 [Podospora pseudopauciseta]KAK4678795.1 hypothetical protein QC764_311193 [Podospora pseudoanserina]
MISSKIVSFLAAALGAGSALASAIPALEKRQRAPGASITYYKDENFQGDKQFFDKDRKDMQCYNLPSDWQNTISSYTNHNEVDWCCRWWTEFDCPEKSEPLSTQTADALGAGKWNDAIKSYRCEANAEDFYYNPRPVAERDAEPGLPELEVKAQDNEGYGSVTFCKDPLFQGECSSFGPADKTLPLGSCVNFADEWKDAIDSFRNDDNSTCCSWFTGLNCDDNRFQATFATNITDTYFHDRIKAITCWDVADTVSCMRDDSPAK